MAMATGMTDDLDETSLRVLTPHDATPLYNRVDPLKRRFPLGLQIFNQSYE